MEKCFNCEGRFNEEEIAGYHIIDNAPLCKKCAKILDAKIYDDDDEFPFEYFSPTIDRDIEEP